MKTRFDKIPKVTDNYILLYHKILLIIDKYNGYCVVEGPDDEAFYKGVSQPKKDLLYEYVDKYDSLLDKVEDMNKQKVLKLKTIFNENLDKEKYNKCFFIVDRDYDNTLANDSQLKIVDGYCMENYFFYPENLNTLFLNLKREFKKVDFKLPLFNQCLNNLINYVSVYAGFKKVIQEYHKQYIIKYYDDFEDKLLYYRVSSNLELICDFDYNLDDLILNIKEVIDKKTRERVVFDNEKLKLESLETIVLVKNDVKLIKGKLLLPLITKYLQALGVNQYKINIFDPHLINDFVVRFIS